MTKKKKHFKPKHKNFGLWAESIRITERKEAKLSDDIERNFDKIKASRNKFAG